jgi:hypothetical protein
MRNYCYQFSFTVKLLCFLYGVSLFSCNKIEPTNPFDPATPKSVFTPNSLTITSNYGGIFLEWRNRTSLITGFKITKSSINSSTPSSTFITDNRTLSILDSNVMLGTTYRYSLCAYAGSNESNVIVKDFTIYTIAKTVSVQNVTSTSATVNSEIFSTNASSIRSRGIWYSKYGTTSSSTTIGTGGTGVYNMNISNLTPNSQYEVRALAIDESNQIIYGNKKIVQTRP